MEHQINNTIYFDSQESQIIDLLKSGTLSKDELLDKLQWDSPSFLGVCLLDLEFKGLITWEKLDQYSLIC